MANQTKRYCPAVRAIRCVRQLPGRDGKSAHTQKVNNTPGPSRSFEERSASLWGRRRRGGARALRSPNPTNNQLKRVRVFLLDKNGKRAQHPRKLGVFWRIFERRVYSSRVL